MRSITLFGPQCRLSSKDIKSAIAKAARVDLAGPIDQGKVALAALLVELKRKSGVDVMLSDTVITAGPIVPTDSELIAEVRFESVANVAIAETHEPCTRTSHYASLTCLADWARSCSCIRNSRLAIQNCQQEVDVDGGLRIRLRQLHRRLNKTTRIWVETQNRDNDGFPT